MATDAVCRALAARWGDESETHDKALRRILKGAVALFVLGMLAALSGLDLSTDLVLWSMVIGAFVAPVAGLALAWRERRRNELWGGRWLTFWASRLGAGTLRLAGLHLAPVRTDAALPPAPETAGALPDDLRSVGEIVSRAETCARRGRLHLAESATRRSRDGRSPPTDEHERERSLQRQLAVLETLLAKFRSGDALTNGDGSLTAELKGARDVCHMVEALIEVEKME